MPKPCNDDQIRNPRTNRCVKRSGKIGKSIRSSSKKRSRSKKRSVRPRMHGRAWTMEELDKLIDYRADGMTIQEIANKLDRTSASISGMLRKFKKSS